MISALTRARRCASVSYSASRSGISDRRCRSFCTHTGTSWRCTSSHLTGRPIHTGTDYPLCTIPATSRRPSSFVAALLRQDDTLLREYVEECHFPVSYLRHCSLAFAQSADDRVRNLFLAAKREWEVNRQQLKLPQFRSLCGGLHQPDPPPQSSLTPARARVSPPIIGTAVTSSTADHYQQLRIPRGASVTDARKAFCRLMKQLPFDSSAPVAERLAKVELIERAVDCLTNDQKRQQHDRHLSGECQPTVDVTQLDEQGRLLLSAEPDVQSSKRKRRQVPAPLSVLHVSCCVCGHDCVNDDSGTTLCGGTSCLKECHLQCAGPRRTEEDWYCPECALKLASAAPDSTETVASTEVEDAPVNRVAGSDTLAQPQGSTEEFLEHLRQGMERMHLFQQIPGGGYGCESPPPFL